MIRRLRVRALAVPALLALVVFVPAFRPAAAAVRHEIAPPTRSLPASGGAAEAEHGISPEEIGRLLAAGVDEGILPDGRRVYLSLHEPLQRALVDLFRRFDPPYGVVAAMEPRTGRVLALVGYRKGGEADPWLPLKALYPAASLIKVVTAAAALETGGIAPQDEILYRGGIYRITPRNIHPRTGRGARTMTLEEAIARSANTVFGTVVVNHVGRNLLEEYMARFGFGERIPFGLPVEVSRGEVPEDEYGLARTGAGFGEVYVSPLHMALIMSAVASEGTMPRPILVERVEDEDGETFYEAESGKWRDTVSPGTAGALLRMMIRTIEAGTSRRTFGTPASTPLLRDVTVAGKTGSLSGWSPRMRFEWFAGVAPVDDPKIAVAALVVNSSRWKIKGSYVGKEAFSAYFGYPESSPPVYARKKRGKVKRAVSGKGVRKKKAASGKKRTARR